MYRIKYPTEQTDPPRSPRETLPTMYDLPSEDPEEPGLPDEFHDFQPELLWLTFCPPNYPQDLVFCASDLNLYYDVHHQNWYKRPDWFGVVGAPRLYDDGDLRLSYVIWQECISPMIIVELLSPGTEKEDLGDTPPSKRNGLSNRTREKPPTKWEVYEQILRVPYYVVFSRYTDQLRVFKLTGGSYQELELAELRVWMPEIELNLGIWQGTYKGITRLWLRWYDAQGNLIPTDGERLEQERDRAEAEHQRAEAEHQRAEDLAQRLRELGLEP